MNLKYYRVNAFGLRPRLSSLALGLVILCARRVLASRSARKSSRPLPSAFGLRSALWALLARFAAGVVLLRGVSCARGSPMFVPAFGAPSPAPQPLLCSGLLRAILASAASPDGSACSAAGAQSPRGYAGARLAARCRFACAPPFDRVDVDRLRIDIDAADSF